MDGEALEIRYKNNKLKKICTIRYEAVKKHGEKMAEKIHQRIDEISSAESIEEMIRYKIGRCHELQGNRKDQFAVDLVHPFRLVFENVGNEIQLVNIIDYH